MLDLQQMPRRADVVDPVGKVLAVALLEPLEAAGGGQFPVERLDVAGDELRLVIDQPPLAAIGLNQAGDEQIVALGVEDVEVQVRPIVFPIQVLPIEKWERDVIAGSVDHYVNL